jgi:signal transduction histidine kinase
MLLVPTFSRISDMSSRASLVQQSSAPEGNSSFAHLRDRWQFLAEASLLLGAADDIDEVLAIALRAAVPWFADVCVIRLHGDQTSRPVALARPELMEAFGRITPREESAEHGADQLDLTRRFGSGRLTVLDEDSLRRIARDDTNLTRWKEVAPTTAITVPICHRGRGFGRIHFLTTCSSGRRYRSRDVMLARDLTQRVASAVDGALRHEQLRHAVASMRAAERETAHDLGDPISTIRLALTDILDSPSAAISLSGRADRDIRIALRAAERTQEVISRALHAGVPADGVHGNPPAHLRIAPFLAALVSEYRVRARKVGVALRLTLAASLPSVPVDAASLSRALANLIGNAIKFTPRGGRVVVAAMVEAGALVLSVSDTGRGISSPDQQHIFESRWRASDDRPGTGLGLAIAKAKVEAIGGVIRCTSLPGEGSTFRIELRL